MSFSQSRACLLLLATATFLLLRPVLRSDMIFPTAPIDPKLVTLCEQDFAAGFLPLISKYRQCLIDYLSHPGTQIWTNLHLAVKKCMDRSILRKFDIHWLYNRDDIKAVILPYYSDSCVVITLGIGRDIRAERQVRHFIRDCRFFGADPIPESGRIYDSMGKYFPVAVGVSNGLMKASVLENGDYYVKNVETVSFNDFLKQKVKEKVVDILFMDNEGAEFDIFRKYFMNEADKVTVCQISVEMHAPLEDYNMNDTAFNALMLGVLSRSPLLPVWTRAPNQHIRSFYVNVRDDVCLKKYLHYRFCKHL